MHWEKKAETLFQSGLNRGHWLAKSEGPIARNGTLSFNNTEATSLNQRRIFYFINPFLKLPVNCGAAPLLTHTVRARQSPAAPF